MGIVAIGHFDADDGPCTFEHLEFCALGDKSFIATLSKSHFLAFKFSKFYHSKCYITLEHSKFQLENRI